MPQGIEPPHPSSYRQRSYRRLPDLKSCSFEVRVEESDLWISGVKLDIESGVNLFLITLGYRENSIAPIHTGSPGGIMSLKMNRNSTRVG